jgi:hypothetical protein
VPVAFAGARVTPLAPGFSAAFGCAGEADTFASALDSADSGFDAGFAGDAAFGAGFAAVRLSVRVAGFAFAAVFEPAFAPGFGAFAVVGFGAAFFGAAAGPGFALVVGAALGAGSGRRNVGEIAVGGGGFGGATNGSSSLALSRTAGVPAGTR